MLVIDWPETLRNLIGYGMALGAVLLVGLLLFLFRRRLFDRFWPLQRLRPGAWTGFDVFVCFVIVIYTTDAVRRFLEAIGLFDVIFDQTPSFWRASRETRWTRELLWAYPLYFFLAIALVLLFLYLRTRTKTRHIGLTTARWPQCVLQGLLGFAIATPLVLAVNLLAVMFLPERPHSLQNLPVQELWPIEWALVFFQACVVAPVLEELLFRGLLQGWLRRASLTGHAMIGALTLFIAAQPLLLSLSAEEDQNIPSVEEAVQPLIFAVLLVGVYGWQFYRVWGALLREGVFHLVEARPTSPAAADEDSETEPMPESGLHPLLRIDPERFAVFNAGNCRLSVLGSAMFFAIFHSSVWPTPIALFGLGLVLGWLAYRTQSLVGAIVLHAFFNVVAFLVLLQTPST